MKMKKMIDKIIGIAGLFFLVYFIGFILFVFVSFLKLIGALKVYNESGLPKNGVVISNHPSRIETVILPSLFAKRCFLHPIKESPWSTPDKTNYYDKKVWFWLRPRAIPIERGNSRQMVKALLKMKDVIEKGGTIILFPEGGRTFKGKRFFYSKKGKRIRELKKGVSWLALKTNAPIVPIWVDWVEKKNMRIEIKIGQKMERKNDEMMEMTKIILNEILKLADKEG